MIVAFLFPLVFGLTSGLRADEGLLVERLQARGFVCTAAEGGDICRISRVDAPGFKYSRPIAMFVPKNVRRPTDLLLHLHGHRGVCSGEGSVENMVKAYALPQQVKAGGAANSVLIFPMSEGKETTFQAELVPQFKAFTDWIKGTVDPARERWVLSGYSGAYVPMGAIVARNPGFVKKMSGAILLDATYASKPGYYDQWKVAAKANPDLRVSTVYRDGGGTEDGSRMLARALPKQDVDVIKSATSSHCAVPNRHYGEQLKKMLQSSRGAGGPAEAGLR